MALNFFFTSVLLLEDGWGGKRGNVSCSIHPLCLSPLDRKLTLYYLYTDTHRKKKKKEAHSWFRTIKSGLQSAFTERDKRSRRGGKEKIKIGKKNLPLLYVLHLIIVPLLFVAVKKNISRDQFANKLKFEKRKGKKKGAVNLSAEFSNEEGHVTYGRPLSFV